MCDDHVSAKLDNQLGNEFYEWRRERGLNKTEATKRLLDRGIQAERGQLATDGGQRESVSARVLRGGTQLCAYGALTAAMLGVFTGADLFHETLALLLGAIVFGAAMLWELGADELKTWFTREDTP